MAVVCFYHHCFGESKSCIPVRHLYMHREVIDGHDCAGTVKVQSCAGYCSSASFPSIDPPFYRPTVRCCQSTNTTRVPLKLSCGTNGIIKKTIFAAYHVQCACQGDL